MARVLLVIPQKDSKNFMVHQPLGAMYLATALRNHRDDDIRIPDLRLHRESPDRFLSTLKEFNPDVVGVSAMAYEADEAAALCRITKDNLPNTITVIGGPAVSTFESDLILDKNIDYTCHGEGEELFPALLDALDKGEICPSIPGLGYSHDGKAVIHPREIPTKDLDDFGFPAWDLIEVEKYFDLPRQGQIYARREYMSVFTSRGCPFHCAYCHNVFGKKFRARSPRHVLEELRILHDQYGIREISMLDDSFNIDKERLMAISDLVCQSGMDLCFNFSNGIRADMADVEILRALKRMGTYKIAVAVESASPRIQKLIHKHAKIDKIFDLIAQAEKIGIMTWGFFMLGFPTETEEEMLSTVRFATRSRLHLASFNIVNPYPGTELFELAGLTGNETCDVTDRYDFLSAENQVSLVPSDRVKRIRRNVNLRFYLNPLRVLRFLRLLPNPGQIFGAVGSFFRRLTVWS